MWMWAFSPRCLRNVHLLPFEHISTFNSRPTTSNSLLIYAGRRAYQMDGQRRDQDRSSELSSNPKVSKLQQALESGGDDTDGWENSWEQGVTPWDLGRPTPVIVDLLKTGVLPKGTALVPGCGSGYDVVALASPERYVVGMDISDTAIQKAIELSLSLPNANYFNFIKANFFTWHPAEPFDLIFDYTFFCAIKPSLRSAWAHRVRDLLKPDGELITLMFPVGDHIGGPPYSVSVADYEQVLHPVGFRAISIVDNDLAIEPRKGREKLGRWKRRPLTESCL